MAYGKISAKQREILEVIKAEILNRGYPPTVRELCDACNLKSTSSIHSHLETLEKNGYIKRDPSKPRAIEIVDDNFNITALKVGVTSITLLTSNDKRVSKEFVIKDKNIELNEYIVVPSYISHKS